MLTEIEVRLVNKNDSDDGSTPTEPVRIVSAEATYEQGSHSVTNAFDGNRGTGWAVYEGGMSTAITLRYSVLKNLC